MDAENILKLCIELIGKIIWPVIIVVLFFNLKAQVRELFSSLVIRVRDSKKLEITKSGIKIDGRAEITEDKLEVLKNKVENGGKHKLADTTVVLLAEYERLSNEFSMTQEIDDVSVRVKKKEELKRKMGVLISSNSLPKNKIIEIKNEGAYVGLLYAISIYPEPGDKAYVLNNYSRAIHPFSKYAYLRSVESLLNNEYLLPNEYPAILKIIHKFADTTDKNLINRVELTKHLIEEKELLIKPVVE